MRFTFLGRFEVPTLVLRLVKHSASPGQANECDKGLPNVGITGKRYESMIKSIHM